MFSKAMMDYLEQEARNRRNHNISQGVKDSWEDPNVAKRRCARHAVSVEADGILHPYFSSTNEAWVFFKLKGNHIRFRAAMNRHNETEGRIIPAVYEQDGIFYIFRVVPKRK